MSLQAVLLAVKQLVSAGTNPGCGGGLVERLKSNLDSLRVHLSQEKSAELGKRLDHLRSTFSTKQCTEGAEATYWEFTVEGLCLLTFLDETLEFLKKKEEISSQASSSTKPRDRTHLPPKALLSISDQKLVQTLLQFVVSLGIYPYLLPGVDTLLKVRLSHAKSVEKSQSALNTTKSWHLFTCSQVLIKCTENSVLGPTVLSYHLSDILASLIQICYGPTDKCGWSASKMRAEEDSNTAASVSTPPRTPGDVTVKKTRDVTSTQRSTDVNCGPRAITPGEREWCLGALQQLLDRVYQPLVVRGLLMLQGMPSSGKTVSPQEQNCDGSPGRSVTVRGDGKTSGHHLVRSPQWLQKACGQLLSACLMKKNGVQHVLRGIFEATSATGPGGRVMEGGKVGGEESAGDWRKCQAVARIIASCPARAASVEEYYSLVCPQVLDLLHLPKEGVGRQFLRVAVATISTMLSLQNLLTIKYIIQPLTRPLDQLCGDQKIEGGADFSSSLRVCIEDLYKICEVVEPSSPFVSTLLSYLPVLFEVWRVSHSSSVWRVSHSSSVSYSVHARELLVRLLKLLNTVTDVLSFLKFITCMPFGCEREARFKAIHSSIALQCNKGELTVKCLSEEGRLESQDTERMESVANCVIHLVETNLKFNCLPGLFFTECLQHIAVVLCRATGHSTSDTSLSSKVKRERSIQSNQMDHKSDDSSSTLLELEQVLEVPVHTEAYSNALVLYLTAALCEHMGDTVLQQSQLHDLIEVMSVIVNCHAQFVSEEPSRTTDILLVAAGPDLEKLLGGSVTLSIVFGLLSAILGGAREVERKDRPLLSGMLPALETIASRYPDQELCSLAGDLKICVTTLGAVWSAEMREKAATVGSSLAPRAKSAAIASVAENKLRERATKVQHPTETGLHNTETNPQQPKKQHSLVNTPPVADFDGGSSFHRALQDLKDPLIPVQGHGLITLTKLIEKRDPETMSNSSTLLTIFRENLMHSDSYIYLAAINGLVALASAIPREIIPTLCQEYALLQGPPSRDDSTGFDKETGQLREKFTRTREDRIRLHSRTLELRMKLGEALVKAVRDCGDTLPQYSDAVLAAILSNVCDSDPMIRASSLSNLADVCSLLKFSFGQIQNEVLSCISHILQTDREPKVRQAALVALKLLIKGLSQDSIQVLGDGLPEVYRLLKQVERGEMDELTRAHAQAALGELDTIMRQLLFSQQTLAKKITVLDKL